MLLTIILGYNHEPIERTGMLPSLEMQNVDFSDVEIIITQSNIKFTEAKETWEFSLDDYPKIKPHVKLLSHSSFMSGPGQSRQNALNMASGEYVVFWDFDDTLTSTSGLSILLNTLKEDKLSGGITQRFEFDVISTLEEGGEKLTAYSEYETPMTLSPLVFRTDFIKKYNLKFDVTSRAYEDAYFSWQHMLKMYQSGELSRKQVHTPIYCHTDTKSLNGGEYNHQINNLYSISDLYHYSMSFYNRFSGILFQNTLNSFYDLYMALYDQNLQKINSSNLKNKLRSEMINFIQVVDKKRNFSYYYKDWNLFDLSVCISYDGSDDNLNNFIRTLARQREIDLTNVELVIFGGESSNIHIDYSLCPEMASNIFVVPQVLVNYYDWSKFILGKHFIYIPDMKPFGSFMELQDIFHDIQNLQEPVKYNEKYQLKMANTSIVYDNGLTI